jgi:hypothetical protein
MTLLGKSSQWKFHWYQGVFPQGKVPIFPRFQEGMSKPFPTKCVTSPSHKVPDAGRRPAGDRLDIVRQAIIAVGGMEAGHSQQVLEDMVRPLAAAVSCSCVHGVVPPPPEVVWNHNNNDLQREY